MHFDGSSHGGRQPRIVIELPAVEKLRRHFACLGSEGVGAIVLSCRKICAAQPGNRGRQVRPRASSGLSGTCDLLGAGEIVFSDCGADGIDDGGLGRRGGTQHKLESGAIRKPDDIQAHGWIVARSAPRTGGEGAA